MAKVKRLLKRLNRIEKKTNSILFMVLYKGYQVNSRSRKYRTIINKNHAKERNYKWRLDLLKREGFISKKNPFKKAWKQFKEL